jgi:hypothetical protein
VLTVTKVANAEYLLAQVSVGVEDYYVGSGEAPGVWQGRLAAELDLNGVVDAEPAGAPRRRSPAHRHGAAGGTSKPDSGGV